MGAVIDGVVPGWALRSGSGSGSGSGVGDGVGDGSGSGVERCQPVEAVRVTAALLRKHGACGDQVSLFRRTFPDGATYPNDLRAAEAAGLSVSWATGALGLLPVLTDDNPFD